MGANVHPLTSAQKPLAVEKTLKDRHLLVTGVTGFLGKVWLSELLYELPEFGHAWVLIRKGSAQSATERFLHIAERSPCFRPLRERHGADLGAFLAGRVTVLEGDISEAMCGLDEATLKILARKLDAVVHFAGLTEFDPEPGAALAINVKGSEHIADLVERCDKAILLHTSTCFVAGTRQGLVPERITVGLSPNGTTFDPMAEADALETIVTTVDDKKQRLAAARERALALGWPNIYTYSKGLAEHLLEARTIDVTTVRPAIVECATQYPFAGWNEGLNTTGPLMWLLKSWFRHFPAKPDNHFDVIPVDEVSRATTTILAAALCGAAASVYQLGSSHSNPLHFGRAVELNNLAVRRDLGGSGHSRSARLLRRYFDVVHVDPDENSFFSVPTLRRNARRVQGLLNNLELDKILPRKLFASIGRPLDTGRENAAFMLEYADRSLKKLEWMLDLYRPFIHDHDWVFATDHIRALDGALSEDERARFGWTLDGLDWRHYYMDVLYPGLSTWCMPILEGGEVPEDPPMSPPLRLDARPVAKPNRRTSKKVS